MKAQCLPVIDVHGGCLTRKWHLLTQERVTLEPLLIPDALPTGWEELKSETV